VFAESDMNQDGEIDLEEFHIRLVEVFYNADRNKDGFLSLEEFNQLPYPEGFKEAAQNGDGKISVARVRAHPLSAVREGRHQSRRRAVARRGDRRVRGKETAMKAFSHAWPRLDCGQHA